MSDLEAQFHAQKRRLGMSANQIARLLDIDRAEIEKVEVGASRPSIQLVRALSVLRPDKTETATLKFSVAVEKSIELHKVHKKHFGQFFTPVAIADFMSSLFSPPSGEVVLLDAGAGKGALTTAFAKMWQSGPGRRNSKVELFEVDEGVLPELMTNVQALSGLDHSICNTSFLEVAARHAVLNAPPKFTHAILNPPYKKIATSSVERRQCREIGFETVNLYSAFVGAALSMLKDGGELVAIVPRSFCNGPYYLDFRRFMLAQSSIEHIHVFAKRDSAFKGDSVLQENVILKLKKGVQAKTVTISTSADERLFDLARRQVDFRRVVLPSDQDCFFHLEVNGDVVNNCLLMGNLLSDLGIRCSTGPLVDFRAKDMLRSALEKNCAPLLYPTHFSGGKLSWPKLDSRKSNAIELNDNTRGCAWPKGHYVVIRRFSSKEERRRIFASVVEPDLLPTDSIVFENHLNVLHDNRRPLASEMAWGLCAFLNSSQVDRAFRSFSGHTQVNATDIRKLRFPSLAGVLKLGQWVVTATNFTQPELDQQVGNVL